MFLFFIFYVNIFDLSVVKFALLNDLSKTMIVAKWSFKTLILKRTIVYAYVYFIKYDKSTLPHLQKKWHKKALPHVKGLKGFLNLTLFSVL